MDSVNRLVLVFAAAPALHKNAHHAVEDGDPGSVTHFSVAAYDGNALNAARNAGRIPDDIPYSFHPTSEASKGRITCVLACLLPGALLRYTAAPCMRVVCMTHRARSS